MSPDEFGRLTYGEYIAKTKGHKLKILINAQYIGMGFNDPKLLGQELMLHQAIMRREG